MADDPQQVQVLCDAHVTQEEPTSYNIQEIPLQSSSTQKYLGVELTSNLDLNIRINSITTKASKTLGLLRRHFRSCSSATRDTAYKALVRP